MKVNKTDYCTEKAGFVTRPQCLRARLQAPFFGRSRVYCLPATMTLLTVCPCAFLSVWVAVSLLLSAEIATLVVTVTLPPTSQTTSLVRPLVRL